MILNKYFLIFIIYFKYSHAGVIENQNDYNKISKRSVKKEDQKSNILLNEILDRKKRKVKGDKTYKWKFTINYFVDNDVDINIVKKALYEIQSNTCLKFLRRSQLYPRMSGIRFIRRETCYSTVGKELEKIWQDISIANYCQNIGGVQHELFHSLGVDHEHNRIDRDNFVTIIANQIKPIELSFFRKVNNEDSNTLRVPYDYGSLMHYNVEASSLYGKNTMVPRHKLYMRTVGQLKGANFNDIKTINLYYCDKQCANKIQCFHGGYQNPINCRVCKCVEGFIGPYCNLLSIPSLTCGKSVYHAATFPSIIQSSGIKRCIYHLITQKKSTIRINIEFVNTQDYNQLVCSPDDCLEVKYWADKTVTGARFCGVNKLISINSMDHHVIIYYKSTNINSGFRLFFRKLR
ncbi:Astacin-like metalloendopeptidase [Strongyloides ratti]|uniref:Metalloendopeptidase n=1 Tax=Strongyloides ratti TaxID=34506 RepID=A0A090MXU9_STRRB|nr:Astacin-like metalloendopeptidase [Strongyloides ratti]CEF66064.1 Astacin-like metalloendopeptidase [Strongyloides ratti]